MIWLLLGAAVAADPWFDPGAIDTLGPPCRVPVGQATMGRTLAVRIWRSPEVSDQALHDATTHAARFWADHAVTLTTLEVRTLDTPVQLGADPMLAPVRAFLSGQATPERPDTIEVIAASSLLVPGSASAARFARLDGLTFAPSLATSDPPLFAALELDAPFTPTVLLRVGPIHPSTLNLTLAHEIGHALGLAHVPSPRDIMYEGRHTCVPGLGAAP